MASNYLEIKSADAYGFTMRIPYAEKQGVISLTDTDIRVQSKVYGGTWYIGGEIKVDGKPLLSMSYNSPATHAFVVFAAGDTWLEVDAINGAQSVASEQITSKTSAVISADITLYRNSSTDKPTLGGSAVVELSVGFAYVKDGNSVKAVQPFVRDMGKWKAVMRHVRNGGKW